MRVSVRGLVHVSVSVCLHVCVHVCVRVCVGVRVRRQQKDMKEYEGGQCHLVKFEPSNQVPIRLFLPFEQKRPTKKGKSGVRKARKNKKERREGRESV